VYQVPPRAEMADEAHRHLHGRSLFDEYLSHGELARRVSRGAVVKATLLSAEFTHKNFRDHYGDKAVILFVVTAAGRLNVITAEQPVEPKPGDTLISLVEEEEEN
jgi:hypothetical protein